eukprot:2054134-Prymnesium_polylepis.2
MNHRPHSAMAAPNMRPASSREVIEGQRRRGGSRVSSSSSSSASGCLLSAGGGGSSAGWSCCIAVACIEPTHHRSESLQKKLSSSQHRPFPVTYSQQFHYTAVMHERVNSCSLHPHYHTPVLTTRGMLGRERRSDRRGLLR